MDCPNVQQSFLSLLKVIAECILPRIKTVRKHKDCDDLNRKESSRRSLRCCSPIPSWRSDKEAIYISGASWTRPSAPYSVITAPKKGKQTRSCPGGVSIFPTKSSNNKKYDSIESKSIGIAADVRNLDEVKTSEYGSADPSPTDSSQSAPLPFVESKPDTEFKAEIQKYEFEIRRLRKRLKEERHYFKGQIVAVQKEKDHMRRYLEKASRAVMHIQRAIDQERRKNSNLRKQLHESDIIIIGLQNQLRNNQYREVERMGSVSCPSCGSTIVGAGEALCALTHSNANLYDDSFTPNVSDAPDEVKSFRNERCSTPAAPPPPRISSPSMKDSNVIPEQIAISEKSCVKSPHSPLRRSYSDSELPSMVSTTEVESVSQECLLQLTHLPTRGELLSESLDGTSFSSDEETTTIELLEKQLRRRGDNVRFVPPRRAVRQATFRRFGRKEISALAEFDYLQNLSTDASGIATSSDYSSPEGRLGLGKERRIRESRTLCKLKVSS
uniref:PEHE domain-containing protein n=1 Tax=Elaeophora elaphi TaxID=1147741 RepID=A0A0R3RSK6_9BILA